ncbi:hypothetical protein KPL70_021641 [Citrus sinensis]|nr:hypothetical protein KPL70_021641 [Citrus sinensis]
MTKMVREASNYIKRSGTIAAIKRLQEFMGTEVPSIMRDKLIKCLRDEERWSLADVVEIGLDDNGLLDIETLRSQLDLYKAAKRPMLVLFLLVVIDAYVKINLRSSKIDGYDAIFLSTDKFLGGPGTPGILLMCKALYQLGSSPPSTCGGGIVNYVNAFNEKDTSNLEDIEKHGGTPQIFQMIRAALAFRTFTLKFESSQGRINFPNQNIQALGNTRVKQQVILSFLVYSTTRFIGMKPGWKRITFPYNMSNEEFEFILAALEFVAGYGQRFRPLYHFNVKEGIWCSRQEAINDSIDKKNNNSIINPLANALKDLRLSNEHKNPDTERLKFNLLFWIVLIYFLFIDFRYTSYLNHIKKKKVLFPLSLQLFVWVPFPIDIDPNILYFRI